MKAAVVIDGRMIGNFDYELPKDDHGRQLACPAPGDEYSSDCDVVVIGPEGETWVARAKLERIS